MQCQCHPHDEGTSSPINSRLIAAAPYLLAAINLALDDIDTQRANGIEPPDWYWFARDVIASIYMEV